MRINADGNVGIGTTNPGSSGRLHVYGGVFYLEPAAGRYIYSGVDGGGHYIEQIGTSSAERIFRLQSTNGAGTYTQFVIDGANQRIYTSDNVNVGIGSGNPRQKLDVFGINSEVYIGNSADQSLVIGNSRRLNYGDLLIGKNIRGVPNADTYRTVATSGATGYSAIELKYAGDFTIYGNSGSTTADQVITPTARLSITGSTGAVSIGGSLSKGSGSFKIDHPLPEKSNTHHLVHSFIEGPQADLIYSGRVQLVNGLATVNIDAHSNMTEGTFVALCRDIRCFTTNESSWDAVRGSVLVNILTIECQNSSSNAIISWMVIGERQDKHMYDTEWTDENGKVIVEPEKIPEINETNSEQ